MTTEGIYLQKFLAAVYAAGSTTRNKAPGVAQVPSYSCVRKEEGVGAEGEVSISVQPHHEDSTQK